MFQANKEKEESLIILNTRKVIIFNTILEARRFKQAAYEEVFLTEMDLKYEYRTHQLDTNKIALVLIDVWASHDDYEWMQRANSHRKLMIVPLLEMVRKHNITIIHAPHERKIANDCKPLPNELVINVRGPFGTTILDRYLKDNDISVLLYAGYATNLCILNRPTGIIKMRELGYNIILIRDCTIAMETPESLKGEWAYKFSINMVESLWGETAKLEDIKTALEMTG